MTKPTDETVLLHWDTVILMIVSWLLRSIDPKLLNTIPFHDKARILWAYVERRYCVVNGPRVQHLRAAITECRQGKTQSLEDYCTKLISLFDEFARLKPLHLCECNGSAILVRNMPVMEKMRSFINFLLVLMLINMGWCAPICSHKIPYPL